ncbi:hypothetical protein [Sphingomonas cannabina]|nr:hypothetical protein [Sphingomonas cannabina]
MAEQDRPDVAIAHQCKTLAEFDLERLAFVDETDAIVFIGTVIG